LKSEKILLNDDYDYGGGGGKAYPLRQGIIISREKKATTDEMNCRDGQVQAQQKRAWLADR